MLTVATIMANAIYVFGGVRDLPYPSSEQWYGKYLVNLHQPGRMITLLKDSALLKIDLSASWNYALVEQPLPMTAFSSYNVSNGPPPFLMYSSMTYDHNGDFHIDGGERMLYDSVNASLNASAQRPESNVPIEKTSWILTSANGSWTPGKGRVPESSLKKGHSLYAQATDQDLVFFLNGIGSNDSSRLVLPKMTIINTRTNCIRTVNTEGIYPLVGAALQYLPLLGQKGGLLLLGGATSDAENITTDSWGTTVIEDLEFHLLIYSCSYQDTGFS
jgi:hypothetical protein